MNSISIRIKLACTILEHTGAYEPEWGKGNKDPPTFQMTRKMPLLFCENVLLRINFNLFFLK